LIVVPTSFNHFTEKELNKIGVNVIIYANHLIRSAYPAMVSTAESILKNSRSLEVDKDCLSIKEILNLIPDAV
jgi:phosphoenolpyruvate phosphomutase / 2-hydroxyethylphosphonate cytidylyltransferase